ncbi:MAG: hypothetical protein PVS2B2_10120 [Candidatus Acidiferrum sp.]
MKRWSGIVLLVVGITLLFGSAGAQAQTSVTTQHNDIARTGANTSETILTPLNVNTNSFGKLYSQPVDGYVYAQPLYMPGVTMGAGTAQAGTTHNVVFIATEHDSVYAFDADSNAGSNANPLWKVSLIDATHGGGAGEKPVPSGDVSTSDIVPEIGITSTPVIDPSTNTLYVVAKSTVGDTTFIQRLHALDITTGQEKFGGAITLSGSVSGNGNGSSAGTLHWDPKWANNRASLLLLNGIVYIGFASHGDNGPWHGWILAYNATTLAQTGVWCATPNAAAAGIWMSGAGLAADVPVGKPYGRIFTVTGNGTFDATTPYTNAMDYGDSILKLDLANGVPTMISGSTTVGDDFTPFDQATLNNSDQDQGSGGVVILPDSVGGGGGKHQLVQLGKTGRIYILDRENLGGYTPTNTKDPQEKASSKGLWGAPAYWNGNIYIWSADYNLTAFSFGNGAISSLYTSISTESALAYSPTPSVSANGTTNGIVWSLKTDNFGTQGREILYAHDATNVAKLLYSSESNVPRDNPGNSVKFIVPTVVNGKVYAGSESQVSVFGLLGGAIQAAAPVISPASQSFNTSLQVTITESTTGASIYYTTDGSTPTTASTKYTAPFTLTTTATVNAIAAGPGILASSVATANYSLISQVATPTFNPPPGAYSAAQSVAIGTSTSNATIYYTTNGTTPTTASTKYTGPVSVGITETLSAIAVASGLSNSAVASGLYTIDLGGATSINFSGGFPSGTMNLLGSAKLSGTTLQLTDGGTNEAAAAWYQVGANIQSFTTDFTFQITPASTSSADGITFTIQGNNASAIGPSGGGLGYGPNTLSGTLGIATSVAVKFDLYNNAGEGPNSTGLYLNGSSPTIPALDMTSSGVNLHSGDPFHVHMDYDGTTLKMTLTDTTTKALFTTSWAVDIPTTVGGNAAYGGFTGGTSAQTATQNVLNWTYTSTSGQSTATPTFSPAAGTYLGTQTVALSDSTAGATIYYTTDGSTPTTSSAQYTGSLTVTATETIKAIAKAAANPVSAMASSTYTIESQVASPTFSPAAGTYTSTQTVTISTVSPNAAIYYTTNGTVPTTASTLYTAPISVSTTQTVQAIAVASGFFNSNVSSAAYTIGSGVVAVNFGSGFPLGAMNLRGSAKLNGTRLSITDGGGFESGSAWYPTAVNIQKFTTNFTFQNTGGTNPQADGFMFVIQNVNNTTIGPGGGGLGYGPDKVGGALGIARSVGVKFDLYNNAGEGTDSTGMYVNGVSPTVPAVDMTGSGVNLHNPDVFNVQMTYDGTNLTMTITDTMTKAVFTTTWAINIPGTVGQNTAWVGFTGATGGATAVQEIIGWTLSATTGSTPAAATPVFSPTGGTYSAAQTVTISDATSGAAIYYTTNGTVPTTASTLYTAPISVSTTQTVQAIAVASGFFNSNVSSAAYTIGSGVVAVNFGSGFALGAMNLRGSAKLNGTRLSITDGGGFESGSAWYPTAVNIQKFTTNFTFQNTGGTNPQADGFMFVIQNVNNTTIGPGGGGLGYGPDKVGGALGIARSVGVKFDLYNNAGEGTDSTGMYVNGVSPTVPAVDMTGSGVNLHNPDVFNVQMTYDGTNLTMTITDTMTKAVFTTTWAINIPGTVGQNTAWVGFTGATGGATAVQEIIGWTLSAM